MRIIKPYAVIENLADGGAILRAIERAGRNCYKSEDKITDDSAVAFIKMLLGKGHGSVIEHGAMTIRFVCDRGVSHELVRHRIASFSQESTRYCNYSKARHGNEITLIEPYFFKVGTQKWNEWWKAMGSAEQFYFELLKKGATPQEARSVLPNSLKTELVMTANMREWREIFRQRTTEFAHPQMRQIMVPLLATVKTRIPALFEDIPDGGEVESPAKIYFWKEGDDPVVN